MPLTALFLLFNDQYLFFVSTAAPAGSFYCYAQNSSFSSPSLRALKDDRRGGGVSLREDDACAIAHMIQTFGL